MVNHKIILELKTSEFNPYWPISIHIKRSTNISECISKGNASRLVKENSTVALTAGLAGATPATTKTQSPLSAERSICRP
jgi:hypothetical protein